MPAISATALELAILCSSGLAATIGGFAMEQVPRVHVDRVRRR